MAQIGSSSADSARNPDVELKLRCFRRSDGPAVKQLFLHGVVYGPNSPANIALKRTLTEPKSYIAYALIGAGTVLSVFSPPGPNLSLYRIGGAVLALGSSALFLLYRRMVLRSFLRYSEWSLKSDMSDIVERYGLKEVQGAKGGSDSGEFVPVGPAGFWVVEKVEGGVGEIVGCAGLDVPGGAGSREGELRRMMVSSSVRRMGIGGMLLNALEGHARVHGLKSLQLMTTVFQPAARRLYEKFGWEHEVERTEFEGNWLFKVPLCYYRKRLSLD
ncbi:hypothetical protein AX16_004162 [Volvariella volvacea WC 439]|nr:hypothetical protein AX16_004162 [Volvariella volvacea WC 439]